MVLFFSWALFNSWPYTAFMTSALFPVGARSGSFTDSAAWAISLGGVVVALLVMALRERAVRALLHRRRVQMFALAVFLISTVGMLAGGLIRNVAVSFCLGALGAAGSGLSNGFLQIVWQDMLTRLSWNEIDVLIPVGYGASLVIASLVSVLAAPVGTVLLFVLSVAAGIMLLWLERPPHSSESIWSEVPGKPTCKTIPGRAWACTATVLVFLWMAVGWVRETVISSSLMTGGIFLTSAVTGAVLAGVFSFTAYLFSRRVDMRFVAGVTVPMLALALFLLAFTPADLNVIPYVLSFTANTIMHIFLHISSVGLAKRGAASVITSTAGIRGPIYFGSLIAALVAPLLGRANTAEVSFVLVLLLLLGVQFLLPQGIEYTGFRFAGDEGRHLEMADTPSSNAPSRLHAIAKEYGLTRRETEIFELFAAGRDSGYIREKLIISRDTVATHIKHIYGKLGIHSKRELIDLLEDRDTPSHG